MAGNTPQSTRARPGRAGSGERPDYRAEITVPVSRERAYRAVTREMSDWWTPMDAPFLAVGDRARAGFGGESHWVLEAETLDGPGLVELRCCGANHVHEGLPDAIRGEWLGTLLRFGIRRAGGLTAVTLTHEGLHRGLLCYDVCEAGWNRFFVAGLKGHLGGG